MKKLWISGPLAALAMFWITSAALAGGFAVTTLDPLPPALQAGETYRIGYVMRQHGVAPFSHGHPRIQISGPHGEQLGFAGVEEGALGRYASDVTFPSEGEWTWSVDQNPFPLPQQFGTITVLAAPVAASSAAPIPALKAQPPVELAMAALVALLLGAVALVLLQVKRVARPAATTATAQMASILTQARRSTATPSRS